jgi:hypothetical protein
MCALHTEAAMSAPSAAGGSNSSSLFEECRDVLLLLRDYLHSTARAHVAEAACVDMGRALGQVEHMLRGSRVVLWGWPAVQAMDALVQVYVELAKQVTFGSEHTKDKHVDIRISWFWQQPMGALVLLHVERAHQVFSALCRSRQQPRCQSSFVSRQHLPTNRAVRPALPAAYLCIISTAILRCL